MTGILAKQYRAAHLAIVPLRYSFTKLENEIMTATATRFSWKQAPDLMARLTTAQNNGRNDNIDIMTFAGMCDSREELETHVIRYETK